MDQTISAPVRGRPGRRKGSGARGGVHAAWGLRAIQALADPSRWRMVQGLGEGPRSLTDLARQVGLSLACTSHHVSILKEAEVIAVRRDSRAVRCSLPEADSRGGRFLAAIPGELPMLRNLSRPKRIVPARPRPATGAPELDTPSGPQPSRRRSIDIEDYLL